MTDIFVHKFYRVNSNMWIPQISVTKEWNNLRLQSSKPYFHRVCNIVLLYRSWQIIFMTFEKLKALSKNALVVSNYLRYSSLPLYISTYSQVIFFVYSTCDMNGHISSTTFYLNKLATDEIINLTTPPDFFVEDKQIWENPTCEGRLIYPEGCVLSLNKSNPFPLLFPIFPL